MNQSRQNAFGETTKLRNDLRHLKDTLKTVRTKFDHNQINMARMVRI